MLDALVLGEDLGKAVGVLDQLVHVLHVRHLGGQVVHLARLDLQLHSTGEPQHRPPLAQVNERSQPGRTAAAAQGCAARQRPSLQGNSALSATVSMLLFWGQGFQGRAAGCAAGRLEERAHRQQQLGGVHVGAHAQLLGRLLADQQLVAYSRDRTQPGSGYSLAQNSTRGGVCHATHAGSKGLAQEGMRKGAGTRQ